MSDPVILKDKEVIVADEKYKLSIRRLESLNQYKCYLLGDDFADTITFNSVLQLRKELRKWIESTVKNNDEKHVVEELKQWDGVVK